MCENQIRASVQGGAPLSHRVFCEGSIFYLCVLQYWSSVSPSKFVSRGQTVDIGRSRRQTTQHKCPTRVEGCSGFFLTEPAGNPEPSIPGASTPQMDAVITWTRWTPTASPPRWRNSSCMRRCGCVNISRATERDCARRSRARKTLQRRGGGRSRSGSRRCPRVVLRWVGVSTAPCWRRRSPR